MASRRRTSSQTLYVNLGSVLAGEPPILAAHAISLCVLFEDLRYELTSIDSEGLEERNIYFLRRSVATLREFVDHLTRLDGLAPFAPVKQSFNQSQRGIWNRGIAWLKDSQERIYDERNWYGAHVNYGAVQKAIETWPPGWKQAMGMEYFHSDDRGSTRGPRFYFIADVMSRVFMNGAPKDTTDEREYFGKLIDMALQGFERATDCTTLVTNAYIEPLFIRAMKR